ncbi:MAG: aminomethyl-transferring glycine dehydrogenase subunit GcvPA [Prevotellamassilia sp.]|nr:aminomethyl-transferring glycine dehydrogenase subunit GcvPA [Bacteroidales bacterium]MEE1270536.1 aminomethyl-transferring glycine dehydrogenase subunit GcvPA [Prevotellamassilia sp.]
MKYIPHTPDDIRAMLDVIGVSSLEDLYAEVPEELKLHRELDIPQSKSEIEVRRIIRAMADKNRKLVPFAGAGVYDHYVPSMIPYITSRSEFSTSYTPYQAEISQGTLQYIFEYQTMMADLTGMDISNASMYDGSTATAEAMLMCVAAAKKRNKVLISATFNPRVLNVVRTYAKFHGVELVEIPAADGLTDREAITRELAAGDVAGVMVAQPNHYGIIEDFTGLADEVHAAKALLVINSIASTLAVLRSPGEWGADIACGDAQSLGIPMNFGGPHIGYLCVKSALVRKMPGRLVGETVDADGKRAFVLTMQAREQHIRREKATSNICTAQGIMCLYVAIYLSLMGRQGLVEVNEQSAGAARALREALLATGKFEEVFPGKPFLNEFALRYVGSESLETLRRRWAENGWLGGVTLDGMPNCLLFAATEQRTQEEIDAFAALV